MKPILLAAVVLLCACHSKKRDTVYRMPEIMPTKITLRRSVFAGMYAMNNIYRWVNNHPAIYDSIIIDRNVIYIYCAGLCASGDVDSVGNVTITDSIYLREHTSYLIDDSTGRRVTDSGGKMIIDTTHPWGHKPQIKTW